MTKRFVFDLNDERRSALEAYRAKNGLRSLAAALHHLIDETAPKKAPPPPPTPSAKRQSESPKPAPFKTRLKGEWKVP